MLTFLNNAVPVFSDFADLVPQPIYWADLDQRILGFSLSALEAIGISSSDQVIGKSPLELYPEEMAHQIIANHKKAISENIKLSFEESIVDAETGEVKVFDATIMPLYDENKNIIGTCGISIDITERKNLEQETIRQKNGLEKKIKFQRNYIKSFGYDCFKSLKNISNAVGVIEEFIFSSNVASELNDHFYTINHSLSEMYTIYQKINSIIMIEEDQCKNINNDVTLNYLESLIVDEINIADSLISAEFEISVSYKMDEKSKQKIYIDYHKVQYILRSFFLNYVKAIHKGNQANIMLEVTAKDAINNMLYVEFAFNGNIPFLELEDNTIRVEHLLDSVDKYGFSYDLSLATHYIEILSKNAEDLNAVISTGRTMSFTLPFCKESKQVKKPFLPRLVG